MRTATKRHFSPKTNHYKRNGLSKQIKTIYYYSLKGVKRKPYKIAGAALLGLGVLSSYLWYRHTK